MFYIIGHRANRHGQNVLMVRSAPALNGQVITLARSLGGWALCPVCTNCNNSTTKDQFTNPSQNIRVL